MLFSFTQRHFCSIVASSHLHSHHLSCHFYEANAATSIALIMPLKTDSCSCSLGVRQNLCILVRKKSRSDDNEHDDASLANNDDCADFPNGICEPDIDEDVNHEGEVTYFTLIPVVHAWRLQLTLDYDNSDAVAKYGIISTYVPEELHTVVSYTSNENSAHQPDEGRRH